MLYLSITTYSYVFTFCTGAAILSAEIEKKNVSTENSVASRRGGGCILKLSEAPFLWLRIFSFSLEWMKCKKKSPNQVQRNTSDKLHKTEKREKYFTSRLFDFLRYFLCVSDAFSHSDHMNAFHNFPAYPSHVII